MSYIEKNLLNDEVLAFTTRKHWVIFILPLLFTLFGFVFWAQNDVLVLLGYLAWFMALYYWLTAITTYITSEYAVTNKRVLIKIGFIQRQTWETLLPKVASLEVNQSIIGRMLGYGTLIIQSTGGGKDSFTVINNPLVFRRRVQEQAEKMQVNLPVQASEPTPLATAEGCIETAPEPKQEPSTDTTRERL